MDGYGVGPPRDIRFLQPIFHWKPAIPAGVVQRAQIRSEVTLALPKAGQAVV